VQLVQLESLGQPALKVFLDLLVRLVQLVQLESRVLLAQLAQLVKV
jgi:hypothetical protein